MTIGILWSTQLVRRVKLKRLSKAKIQQIEETKKQEKKLRFKRQIQSLKREMDKTIAEIAKENISTNSEQERSKVDIFRNTCNKCKYEFLSSEEPAEICENCDSPDISFVCIPDEEPEYYQETHEDVQTFHDIQ